MNTRTPVCYWALNYWALNQRRGPWISPGSAQRVLDQTRGSWIRPEGPGSDQRVLDQTSGLWISPEGLPRRGVGRLIFHCCHSQIDELIVELLPVCLCPVGGRPGYGRESQLWHPSWGRYCSCPAGGPGGQGPGEPLWPAYCCHTPGDTAAFSLTQACDWPVGGLAMMTLHSRAALMGLCQTCVRAMVKRPGDKNGLTLHPPDGGGGEGTDTMSLMGDEEVTLDSEEHRFRKKYFLILPHGHHDICS